MKRMFGMRQWLVGTNVPHTGFSVEEFVAGIMQPKRYKKRCEQHIAMCIQDLFAPLLQVGCSAKRRKVCLMHGGPLQSQGLCAKACSQLAVAGENTDKRTKEILDQAHDFKTQLADIYDYVTPCFPERQADAALRFISGTGK